MASSSSNSSSSNGAKEQLLVCWLEPQSDAGKVSAIPPSWIVSTVSGDGRSPDSVVRCRWPRTKRLYRARIVSSNEQQSKTLKENNEDDQDLEGSDTSEKRPVKQDTPPAAESPKIQPAAMVKEEPKPTRTTQVHAASNSNVLATSFVAATTATVSSQNAAITSTSSNSQSIADAAALVQVLMPSLKKLLNNELSRLSTDIQANFDIIGHKISALDGTVKCIKTRVDRMELLLNTAAQELGDNQTSTTSNSNLHFSSASTPRSTPNDLSSSTARNFSLNNTHQSNAGGMFNSSSISNRNSASAVRYPSSIGNANRNAITNAVNAQLLYQRRQAANNQNRIGTQPAAAGSFSQAPIGSRPTPNAVVSSYPRPHPTSFVSMVTQRPLHTYGSFSAPSSLKRRRTTATTNPTLPKAVVVTAPNGIDIFLGGDKNYKMPLVMYKDAMKNCTRPVPTYLVMALIRRYLTPDEMSRTWLTDQQLLGKKDGVLLDQNLLSALKKQALMQFPSSGGIDDRLLIRKLYDVFHGIRRQMRKKRRDAGESGLDSGSYDNQSTAGMNDNDGDSGSGNGEAMDEDTKQTDHESGGYDDHMNDFDDEEGHDDHEADDSHALEDNGQNDCLMGHDGLLNGDEDLEEMAAKQAAFWAGADDI